MKPSDRILQIAKEIIKKNPERKPLDVEAGLDLRVECIERFLDEEWKNNGSK
mgnify:CR=1 FL=1